MSDNVLLKRAVNLCDALNTLTEDECVTEMERCRILRRIGRRTERMSGHAVMDGHNGRCPWVRVVPWQKGGAK